MLKGTVTVQVTAPTEWFPVGNSVFLRAHRNQNTHQTQTDEHRKTCDELHGQRLISPSSLRESQLNQDAADPAISDLLSIGFSSASCWHAAEDEVVTLIRGQLILALQHQEFSSKRLAVAAAWRESELLSL